MSCDRRSGAHDATRIEAENVADAFMQECKITYLPARDDCTTGVWVSIDHTLGVSNPLLEFDLWIILLLTACACLKNSQFLLPRN
jgi:hypothetical protein